MKERKLAWAVLTNNTSTGRSEVIKVTDHEEADKAVKDSEASLNKRINDFIKEINYKERKVINEKHDFSILILDLLSP